MVRLMIAAACFAVVVSFASADADSDPRITRALALQKAITDAKSHLDARRPLDAATVLEAEILFANGDERYLALLKETYIACLRELSQNGGNTARVDHFRRQLRILDPQLNTDDLIAAVSPAPATMPERIDAPAPAKAAPKGDPFQQMPLDRQPAAATKPKPQVAMPDGWQSYESTNFRVLYRQNREQAGKLAARAEQLRSATFERWFGPAGADWAPRCDVWLHVTATEYAAATQKPAATPGHASVGIREGKVLHRRIDLRLDSSNMHDSALPREIGYVVLADLFPDQPLPTWAHVGMTIQGESPMEISRYLRSMARLLNEKKLLAVRDLLKMPDFPEAERITAFYVGSVSLVDYLVKLKGPRAFVLYLREAPRRGYEEALDRHYGIKDAADLHDRWLKASLKGE